MGDLAGFGAGVVFLLIGCIAVTVHWFKRRNSAVTRDAKSRRTARVYVLDPASRVLLIRFVVMRAGGEFCFWLTPGGEIESGESEAEAAARELHEELGLEVTVSGPVYSEANQFEHQGQMRDNVDYYFVARCGVDAPRMGGVTAEEIAVMREIRWWAAEEIEAAVAVGGDRFFPVDLAARVREFGDGEKQVLGCTQDDKS